ncbi:hypothetical protein [Vulcanisaeta souniana]|nr:hypothetical protein [Vulcanisaeta souniana]
MGLYSLITGLGRTMASSISGVLLSYAIKQPFAMWGFVFAVAISSSGLYSIIIRDALVLSRRA